MLECLLPPLEVSIASGKHAIWQQTLVIRGGRFPDGNLEDRKGDGDLELPRCLLVRRDSLEVEMSSRMVPFWLKAHTTSCGLPTIHTFCLNHQFSACTLVISDVLRHWQSRVTK
jgi:hypothetical protein